MTTAAMVDSRINTDPDIRRSGLHAHHFDTWLFRIDDNQWNCCIYHVTSRRGFSGDGHTFPAAITEAVNQLKAALPQEHDE